MLTSNKLFLMSIVFYISAAANQLNLIQATSSSISSNSTSSPKQAEILANLVKPNSTAANRLLPPLLRHRAGKVSLLDVVVIVRESGGNNFARWARASWSLIGTERVPR